MVVVYLHGFASSPQSSKATFFAERFARRGVMFACPDLNRPSFSALTVSRMLQQLERQIAVQPPADVVLIGSSLGGFVAVEAAARHMSAAHPITRLILLAPAIELEWERWSELGPGGIERWRTSGEVEVFHYALNRPERLRFGLYEDAANYDPASRRLDLPMLIFQGRHDESVSPSNVERFAERQANAILHMVDDGHQLKNSLEFIWYETERFLGFTLSPQH
jgi:uncharacterized protein